MNAILVREGGLCLCSRDFNRRVQNILRNFLSHAETQRRKEER
jgi:hypothetical protein